MRLCFTKRCGFTLTELMAVVAISSILAGIALPMGTLAIRRAQEDTLRRDLLGTRSSVRQFLQDTGCFPAQIADVAGGAAPANGITQAGATCVITSSDWKGPYLQKAPVDVISQLPFGYSASATSTSAVGTVTSSAPGSDSQGVSFATY